MFLLKAGTVSLGLGLAKNARTRPRPILARLVSKDNTNHQGILI